MDWVFVDILLIVVVVVVVVVLVCTFAHRVPQSGGQIQSRTAPEQQ